VSLYSICALWENNFCLLTQFPFPSRWWGLKKGWKSILFHPLVFRKGVFDVLLQDVLDAAFHVSKR
jgi:hypothetical protein